MDAQDKKMVRIIGDHGLVNAVDIVRAHRSLKDRGTDVPLSVCCAMLQMETGGANVYGHDPVRRGQVFGGHVTHASYLRYKAMRRLGFGNQGVGPCQLTSTGLQDEADRRGGCWKPLHNMTTGFNFLHNLYAQTGSWRLAFQHYNGSGPAAVHYGESAASLAGIWHNRLT